MNEGKRTVEQIKRDVAEGKWRCVTPEQDARGIIEALAAVKPEEPGVYLELYALINRAKRHMERVQSHDVGAGDVNTDFWGDGSPQA